MTYHKSNAPSPRITQMTARVLIVTLVFALFVPTLQAETHRDNYRPLKFPNNGRPAGVASQNYRPLGFDPPPIRYPAARYSLDSMRSHPYILPGNTIPSRTYIPRFKPGLGYQSFYGSLRSREYRSLNPYSSEYDFGIRRSTFQLQRMNPSYRYRSNSLGGPWYYPGASTNTSSRFTW